ncbi:hypothetical protein BHM03_00048303 [Ensete ventricosum]|nr:hypothetical protein BHM03_00048303 [Ensete ventricosum]
MDRSNTVAREPNWSSTSCSGAELAEHYCSGIELVEHCYSGTELVEHCCSGTELAEHYCLGAELAEHCYSGAELVEHCCSRTELTEHYCSCDARKGDRLQHDTGRGDQWRMPQWKSLATRPQRGNPRDQGCCQKGQHLRKAASPARRRCHPRVAAPAHGQGQRSQRLQGQGS